MPTVPTTILREATIALGVVLALTVALTVLFSSPDIYKLIWRDHYRAIEGSGGGVS